MSIRVFSCACALGLLTLISSQASALNVPVEEDVMTSAFFFSPNFVRGYAGDNRNEHRVGSDNAFGLGPETIYLTFDPTDFGGLTAPVKAFLTMESAPGGFGGDASSGNPFVVSAHAVDTDPLAAITDDTNPSGPTSWIDFFNNNILPADSKAKTSIDSFGTVTFDVSAVVNDWINGSNTVFTLAMTGKNDSPANDFLHGFLNNTENPGSTFLTITVPEPGTLALGCLGVFGLVFSRKN